MGITTSWQGATLDANTFTGTQTFADGTVIASTGISNAASFTTVSTAALNYAPTWTYTATSGASAVSISPVLVPAGASSSLQSGVIAAPALGTSSVNITTARALVGQFISSAGYSGTVTTGIAVLGTFTNAGTNPITNAYAVFANALSNGNGITSGTVQNFGLHAAASTAAAAAGGAVINRSVNLVLGTGSGAGTTSNYGLYITGNGGTGGGGTTNNFAIFSDSTAASSIAGGLTVAAVAIPAGGTLGAGLLFSTTANFGILFGSGAPDKAAAQGTLYIRSDGSSNASRAYIATDGSGTWTAITTVG